MRQVHEPTKERFFVTLECAQLVNCGGEHALMMALQPRSYYIRLLCRGQTRVDDAVSAKTQTHGLLGSQLHTKQVGFRLPASEKKKSFLLSTLSLLARSSPHNESPKSYG